MIRALVLLALMVSSLCFGQAVREDRVYFYTKTISASSSTSVTVQIPAINGASAKVLYWIVRCTAACDGTLRKNGSIATSTPDTVQADRGQARPKFSVYYDSNSTGGQVLRTYKIPANSDYGVPITRGTIADDGTSQNMSFDVAVSGTVEITVAVEQLGN